MKTSVRKICEYISKCADGPKTSFSIYLRGYGGFNGLKKSIYVWVALALAILTSVVNNFFVDECWKWWEDVISIVPSVLGFSLGGYAFIVGFGNEKFMEIMRAKEKPKDISPYMKVNATFLHFILVQFMSIASAILFKSLHITGMFIFDILGVFFFFYSLFTIVSTSFCVLNLSDWFDAMKKPDDETEN